MALRRLVWASRWAVLMAWLRVCRSLSLWARAFSPSERTRLSSAGHQRTGLPIPVWIKQIIKKLSSDTSVLVLLTCHGLTAQTDILVLRFQLLSARLQLSQLLLHLKQAGLQGLPLRPAAGHRHRLAPWRWQHTPCVNSKGISLSCIICMKLHFSDLMLVRHTHTRSPEGSELLRQDSVLPLRGGQLDHQSGPLAGQVCPTAAHLLQGHLLSLALPSG